MAGKLPLEHVFITDLTQAWAGAYATQLLADFGATVVKIESRNRPDPWRGGFQAERGIQAYPADGPGERPYNRSYLANSVNRNKYGITLNLGTAEGRAIFLDLVRRSDVVAENFTPRVLGNFGLGYGELRRAKADIILLSMPAFGLAGPYSDYPGIGGTVDPMSGNSALLGEPGASPQTSGVMYPDAVAGLNGAAAVLSALHRRAVTGLGCHMEVSQQESMMAMIAPFIARGGQEFPMPFGNGDFAMAPHGIFRAGDGGWVAVAARDDGDWAQLVEACGEALEPYLDEGVAGRRARRTEIEGALSVWVARRTAQDAETALATAGVPAARVREMSEVLACPQLNARGFMLDVEQPEVGLHRMAGVAPRLAATPGSVRWPAPGHGADSGRVLREILGLSHEEVARLEAAGITGEGPPAEGAPGG